MQSLNSGIQPQGQGLGGYDPRAIAANPQGFQDHLRRARGQSGPVSQGYGQDPRDIAAPPQGWQMYNRPGQGQPQGQGRVPDWAIQHMQGQGQPQGQGNFQMGPGNALWDPLPQQVSKGQPQSNLGGGAQTQTLNPVSPTNYNTYGNNMPVGFRYGGGIRSLKYNG